tara:strand:- start:13723 stop:14094 length:372 start_codon:yes stop_codon:yes gene_type:complete
MTIKASLGMKRLQNRLENHRVQNFKTKLKRLKGSKMPDEDDLDYQRSIEHVTKVVERIETKLVGDLDTQGLIGKVYENSRKLESNTERIKAVEIEDNKKKGKELALAVSIILLLIGIVFNLLK